MKHCLVVDDSEVIRKVARRILEALSFEIAEAENGEEAMGRCHMRVPDAILLDWQMPVMDGLEFMKTVMKVPEVASIPIVMITASGSEENKNQVRSVNPNLAGYVVKPYTPNTLIETIKPYLK